MHAYRLAYNFSVLSMWSTSLILLITQQGFYFAVSSVRGKAQFIPFKSSHHNMVGVLQVAVHVRKSL